MAVLRLIYEAYRHLAMYRAAEALAAFKQYVSRSCAALCWHFCKMGLGMVDHGAPIHHVLLC